MLEQITTYAAAEDYINAIPRFTGKSSIEDTRRFLAHMGNPGTDRKIIHIAGTNGKGSVCAYLCSVFRRAGISAGMFTSPHLVAMRERMAVNGRIAAEEEFLEAFRFVADRLGDLPPELAAKSYHPSFFEFLFFMAMYFFDRAGAEYIVLETGLGGRLDATNAVTEKALCVITSIGYDHMEYLGDTLGDIAAEKAGILRRGVPVVYPVLQPEATARIEVCAAEAGAVCVPVSPEAIKEIKIRHKTIDFSLQFNYDEYIGFTVSTPALYQVQNAALAVRALLCLEDGRITVPVMQEGIRGMVWEGRMEEILPSVYLDGAHNIDGIRAFLDTVKAQPGSGRRKLLFSVVRDKQYQALIREIALSGLFDEIGVVQLHGERALPLDMLQDTFGQYTDLPCTAYGDLRDAVADLKAVGDAGDRAYIVGSLYLAGEIKALLRRPGRD